MPTQPKRWQRWAEERFRYLTVQQFLHKQLYKRLPPHIGWLHVLGSLALLTFLSQFITGILLLLYYRPTLKEAHDSIQYITGEVPFGWLIRQVHAWGASLMMLAVLLHMTRTYFMAAFKRPREFTWLLGVFLFMGTMTFGFTGYLLPWNQLSYWATTVGTEVVGAVPVIGDRFKLLLLGGPAVGQETLSRFFLVHVTILPWFMVMLLTLHLVFMRVHNLATLDDVGQEKHFPPEAGVPFWPVHMAKEAGAAMICFGVLFTLSVVSPWDIGPPANPLETPAGIKPEWYFLPTYQLLKYMTGPVGKVVGILLSGVPFLLLFLWPFVERAPGRRPSRRVWAVSIGIVAVFLAVSLGILGYLSETTVHIGGWAIEFDISGVPSMAGR
jgi:quinol-cytochrome oxidoreductase complex cytochrome b subunit